MALSGVTAPPSAILSSHDLRSPPRPLPPSPSPSSALLLLSGRRLSRFRNALVSTGGGADGKPLLLSVSASTKGQQCEGDFAGAVSQFVEVIGIGSRRDAALDFCADSPFLSKASVRFWNLTTKDSAVFLQQRVQKKEDVPPNLVEAEIFPQCHPKATILVASAGYGSDHTTAIEILKSIRSMNGFTIAIVLRPFSFEGQRRKDEVHYLVEALQEHTSFCIDINTDMLFKKDVVTLDEALKTANTAVLSAINAISILTLDSHTSYLAVAGRNMKELNIMESFEVLQNHKEAKIGFGIGHDIRRSIVQAVYQCPFLSHGVKDLQGVVLCILASSDVNENDNFHLFLDTFRQLTGYEGEVILSIIHEPNLEANIWATTVVTLGSVRSPNPQKSTLLSRLASHFPFLSGLLRKETEADSSQAENPSAPESMEDMHLPDLEGREIQISGAFDSIRASSDVNREEMLAFSNGNSNAILASSESEQTNSGQSDSDSETIILNGQAPEVTRALQREQLSTWSFGPGYVAAQAWAKERAENDSTSLIFDNLSICHLPVGVRLAGESKTSEFTSTDKHIKGEMENNGKATSSTVLKRKEADIPKTKRQGVLSVRAASMLESERDSPKKWNPIVEMQYRGGFYRGRCQGGLPEGKGRLVLGDGSIYDGMWRYGKRSGSGTFYFSNGDVFQGSWRDDVMHGKGWFYFHTGDRWFANFWKGRANGEGRFYTKSGEVFFGQFKDGWRHGQFLCIEVDGERHTEVWNKGVLVSRQQLNS